MKLRAWSSNFFILLTLNMSLAQAMECPTATVKQYMQTVDLTFECALVNSKSDSYSFSQGEGCLAVGKRDGKDMVIFDGRFLESVYGELSRTALYWHGLPKWDTLVMNDEGIHGKRLRPKSNAHIGEDHQLQYEHAEAKLSLRFTESKNQTNDEFFLKCK